MYIIGGLGGDAGGWRPDQGGRENEAPSFSGLNQKKLDQGWGDLQLLRGRSQRLLVTSPTGADRSPKPGGGAQGDGSRRQEAKD